MFGFFKKKLPIPVEEPTVLTVIPKIEPGYKIPGIGVRKWVTTRTGRIGILNSYLTPETVEIHYIGEQGQTTEEVAILTSDLRLAYIEEIPLVRRPSLEAGIPLGYFPAPIKG